MKRGAPMKRGTGFKAKPKKRRVTNPLKADTRSAVSKKPLKDAAHLARIRTLACIACIRLGFVQMSPTQAHHCRQGKMGVRPGDDRAAPVCVKHHLDQYPTGLHKIGEKKFWAMIEINPDTYTERLYAETLAARATP